MRADVQPAAVEIELEHAHHLLAQRALRGAVERALGRQRRLARLLRRDAGDEARQPLLDLAEDAIDGSAAHARLVAVDQRVVGRQAALVGEMARLFAAHLQHRLQVDREAGPVVGLALRAPRVLAARGGERAALHQFGGQRVGAEPVAFDLAQVRALRVAQRFVLRAREMRLQLRIGAHAVREHRDLGQRLAARRVALGRHVGGLVPAGHALQVAEAVQALPGGGEGVVGRRGGRCHGGSLSRMDRCSVVRCPATRIFAALRRPAASPFARVARGVTARAGSARASGRATARPAPSCRTGSAGTCRRPCSRRRARTAVAASPRPRTADRRRPAAS